jgi:hypothetical protein
MVQVSSPSLLGDSDRWLEPRARHVEGQATPSGAVGNGGYYIAVVTALTAEAAIMTRPVPA